MATTPDRPAAAPALLGYFTWHDEDGYHARAKPELKAPPELSEVHAATALELTQEAVRNRVRVWVLRP